MRKTPEGDRTYQQARAQFDDYQEQRRRRPTPAQIFRAEPGTYAPLLRAVWTVAGAVIALTLIIAALMAAIAAYRWGSVGRSGAVVGYSVIAFFYAVAGLGCLVATYNHNYRGLNRTPEQAEH